MDHGTMDHGTMDYGTMDYGTMDYGTMGPPAKGLLKKAPGGGHRAHKFCELHGNPVGRVPSPGVSGKCSTACQGTTEKGTMGPRTGGPRKMSEALGNGFAMAGDFEFLWADLVGFRRINGKSRNLRQGF